MFHYVANVTKKHKFDCKIELKLRIFIRSAKIYYHSTMSNDNIMKGYKGIMDLDLSTIDPKFHDEVRKQHLAEIKEYKAYQRSLPPKLRYENTTVRALKIITLDRDAARTEALKREKEQNEKDQRFIDTYNRVQTILSYKKKEH